MRICILQCDHVVDELSGQYGDYPEMFRNCLGKRHGELEFLTYDLTAGDWPVDLDACDGFLVTGSRYSVYDQEPWIEQACELLRRLNREGRPTVGICFGHQLIAQALGGRVTKAADKGWGIGVHSWRIVNRPDWMQPASTRFSLLVSHQDQVLDLPPDSQLLATSDFCPNAAFQVGEHLLGIQGHPEFLPGYSQALMDRRIQQIGPDKVAEASATLNQPVDDQLVAEWIVSFIKSQKKAE